MLLPFAYIAFACGVRKLIRRPEMPVCGEIVFTHPTPDVRRSEVWPHP
jgi:hypothetical protein